MLLFPIYNLVRFRTKSFKVEPNSIKKTTDCSNIVRIRSRFLIQHQWRPVICRRYVKQQWRVLTDLRSVAPRFVLESWLYNSSHLFLKDIDFLFQVAVYVCAENYNLKLISATIKYSSRECSHRASDTKKMRQPVFFLTQLPVCNYCEFFSSSPSSRYRRYCYAKCIHL